MLSRKKTPPRRSDASPDHSLDRRETAECGFQEGDGEDEWYAALASTHDAVCAYARKEFQAFTRKVIYRLPRIPASGIYGDDYIYKTLWDEYCHEVQKGPYDMPGLMGLSTIAGAWEMTLQPLLDDVIENIPRHAAVLLSIFAMWEFYEEDDLHLVGAYSPDSMRQVLQGQLNEAAGERNLHHLGPWRNY